MEYEKAIALIETRGIVALTAGIEAMMKTADVECISVERISSGYFAAAVRGSVAAVKQAVEAGNAAVNQYGELRATQVYAKPHEDSADLLENGTREQLGAGSNQTSLSSSTERS